MPNLSAGPLALVLLSVAIGGTIQGAIGFGFALICVPVLALVLPEAVPFTVLFLALPLTVWMALRERAHIDVRGFLSILAGRVLGTAAGVWILVAVSSGAVSVLLGSLIVVAVLVSALGLDVEPTRGMTFGAGIVSGVMGTASAIGGPALVVVYQRRPGPELRSTLALSFTVGLLMSIGALLAAGEIRAWHAVLALELLPALGLGLWLSRSIARFLDARWLRPAVLAFALLAGVVIAVRGVLG
ncbi:MAG TPA: sulfite exporter TauE/SafE family protein [Actinomycetota bacterium]|nr:sulfite exporter TauE/SafE family protein [Actinomycetota bacterium]